MSTGRNALSPPVLIRNGLDWSGRSARLPYMLVALTAMVLASLIPSTQNFSGANTVVFVALTMVFPVWLGHTRRRLRDMGWSGWWMWLAILPIVSLVMLIYLSMKPGDQFEGPSDAGYSRLAYGAALLCGLAMLSRAFWAPYWIPAESMAPSLLVGDFIAVVPVNEPARGDILVYRNPLTGQEYVNRLIGLPGDKVQMVGGQVHLNDAPLPQRKVGLFGEPVEPDAEASRLPDCTDVAWRMVACLKGRLTETLPDGRSYDVLDAGAGPADETEIFVIGPDQYFFIGDNRDDSIDSRQAVAAGAGGLIPRENLTGRAALVLFSSAGDSLLHVWAWRHDRLFWRIE